MREWQSQSHVRWYCRYHVVWVPKYRKRAVFGQMRRGIGRIVRELGVGAGPARHSIPDPLVSSAATVAQCPGELEGAPEVQDQIPRWELVCV